MSNLLSAIAPYVPPILIRSVLADPAFTDAPIIERFQAAVLFVDVSGFTPLTAALAEKGAEGPEELRSLLNRYFGAMITLTEAEGGGVVKFSGDAMTVLFLPQDDAPQGGVPQDDAPQGGVPQGGALHRGALGCAVQRACRAAKAMQSAMVGFANLQTSVGVVTLGMKISIGAGEVLAMQVGGIFNRWEYVIAGDPLRQVAEAEHRASRGDIILSPEAEATLCPTPLPARPLVKYNWSTIPNLEAVEANLRRFVPGPALGWLEEGLLDWLPVLRPITVLFVEVAGLQYDRPDIAERLHQFLRATQQTLYRYEGTLRQLVVDDKGTVVMALFGAPPFAHEDDPERAALCALHLQRVAVEQKLGLSIGIATGHVFSGPVGGETRYEYTAMGDTVNLAARLMGESGVGNILCEFETYRQARDGVRFETLPPIRVKGKTGLIRVYGPLGKLDAFERTADDGQAVIVGREAELARLAAAFDAVRAGESRILIIEGEAGIGKTRLVTELTRMTKEQGLIWFVGAGDSIERQTPYRAWRDILTFYFGLEEREDLATRRARVQTMVQELLPAQMPRVPLLNDIINLGIPDTDLTASLDPQLRQQGLVVLVLALLRAWTRERPLILIVEDAQWLDSLSWALTVEVARTFIASEEPLLLVVVTRLTGSHNVGHEYLETLRAMPVTETLALGPLVADDMITLISARLGLSRDVLPAPVISLVQRWAEGNPFFAEELLFALRDEGMLALTEDEGGGKSCTICGDLTETAQTLPDTVQGLVLARIDRQPPERQLILKTASVIGRTFDYASLCYVLQRQTAITDSVLRPHLDALDELELTLLHSPEPELAYAFKNLITQEVAYETLLFAQRRALHHTVAEWYEQLVEAEREDATQDSTPADSSLSSLPTHLPLLVHHYHQAGIVEKEHAYARLAGEQAAARFANAEAVRYFSRALELTPESELERRYALLLSRERVYALQGNREAQERDLAALEHLSDALGDRQRQAEVALHRAHYAEVIGDYAGVIAAAQRVIDLALMVNDEGREAAGYLQWGRALWLQGENEAAVPQLERALILARRAGRGQVEADSMRTLGVIAYYEGNHPGATTCFELALAIFQSLGDRRGEGGALNNLGVVFYNHGDYARARDYYQQGLRIYREIGYRQGEGRAIGNLAIIAHRLGNYGEAQVNYEHALTLYREVSFRQGESTLLSYLSLLFHHLGDQRAAKAYGLRALALAEELEDSLSQGFALTNIGHALLGLGQPDGATEAYQRAVEIRREAGHPNLAIESLAGLADVCMAQESPAGAWLYVEQILGHLKTYTLDGTIEPFRVYWTCYRMLRDHRDARAEELLTRAYTLLQEQADSITDSALRQSFLDNVAPHRDIAREFACLLPPTNNDSYK